MATTTTNLGLIEPAGQDRALVANINTNSEKIDAEAGKARANFALVQNGDTATQAISQGELVIWKGALKKATANIASGATLSSSNLTDDSIATEIASLNTNIANIKKAEKRDSYATLDALKTYIGDSVFAISALQWLPISFQAGFANNEFSNGENYAGFMFLLHKGANLSGSFFSGYVVGHQGDLISIGFSAGTWRFGKLAFNT